MSNTDELVKLNCFLRTNTVSSSLQTREQIYTHICELKVWPKSLFHSFLHENSSFGNLSEQQSHNHSPLVAQDSETQSRNWCFSCSLKERLFGISIFQLNCPDFSKVEEVSAELHTKKARLKQQVTIVKAKL